MTGNKSNKKLFLENLIELNTAISDFNVSCCEIKSIDYVKQCKDIFGSVLTGLEAANISTRALVSELHVTKNSLGHVQRRLGEKIPNYEHMDDFTWMSEPLSLDATCSQSHDCEFLHDMNEMLNT